MQHSHDLGSFIALVRGGSGNTVGLFNDPLIYSTGGEYTQQ